MKYIKQLLIILAVSCLAEVMETMIPLPVAASVYGLLIMLVGLWTKVIPLQKVEGVADYLVGIMSIMFIPPTVAIMASFEQLKTMLVPLVVISFVTTILVMIVTGRVSQFLLKRGKKNE